MKEITRQLFARALDAIEAADILLTNDKVDFAAWQCHRVLWSTLCEDQRTRPKISSLVIDFI